MTLAEHDLRRIVREAVAETIAQVIDLDRPLPDAVSVQEAARILGKSPRTISRMALKRNGVGKVLYSEVLRLKSAR